jgi:hypothetical protein
MKNFFRKLFERLLVRTDALQKKLDASLAPNDPLRKKMDKLVAKREAYRKENSKANAGKTVSLTQTLNESLAAKKSAINSPKRTRANRKAKQANASRSK